MSFEQKRDALDVAASGPFTALGQPVAQGRRVRERPMRRQGAAFTAEIVAKAVSQLSACAKFARA